MSRINIVTSAAIAALVLLPNQAISQEKTLKQQIQGPWSQVSCNSTNARGEKAAYCANDPRGIMILAGNGNYAITIIAGGRKDANAPGIASVFGTWSVNEADKTLTIHFVGASNPAIEGKNLKLNISLNGEELKTAGDLTVNNQVAHIESTYRRFK
jgi:hypothetical protein